MCVCECVVSASVSETYISQGDIHVCMHVCVNVYMGACVWV